MKHSIQAAAVEKEKRYSELVKRIEREKQLAIIEEKLSLQKALLVGFNTNIIRVVVMFHS